MAGSRRFPPADGRARADAGAARALPHVAVDAAGGCGTASHAGDTAVEATLCAAVRDSLATSLPHGGRIAVALSGGRDSIALLDVTLAIAASVRCSVVALHVHHALSANADRWAEFCRERCTARDVRFDMRRVQVPCGPRISVEAAARTARYHALAELAHEHRASAVLLAHHADDQAETTLLQLLRGAGPRGLAAMPGARFDGRLWWLRPLLAFPRSTLERYVAQRALAYVDDDSNSDRRYRRNALRNVVVPSLRSIAPGYPATLVRAAKLQAEASALLDDLAALDARGACDAVTHDGTTRDGAPQDASAWDGTTRDGVAQDPAARDGTRDGAARDDGTRDGGTLDASALVRLDARRARNLLRWFLRRQGLPAPSASRLADMLRQLAGARPDARTAIRHAGAELFLYRGRVTVQRFQAGAFACEWKGAESVVLPHGTLLLERGQGFGIDATRLASATVTIRSGVPGERLRMSGRKARNVADLLREAGVPPWQRLALPRIWCDDSLAAVVPLGVDAEFAAMPGNPAFALRWRPAPEAH